MSQLNSVKTVGKIYETTDYNMFKPLAQNRGAGNNQGVKKGKVKKIVNMILQDKFIYELSPIQVNQKNQIIDGHHRLAAMKEVGKPVRFIVINDEKFNQGSNTQNAKVEFVNNIYTVNGTNPTWTGKDLYKAGIELKLELALGIEQLLETNEENFDYNDVLALLTKNLDVFKGAKKAGYDVKIFADKNLLNRFKSDEFQEELDYFVKLNQKYRISPRRKTALSTFYSLMWNAEKLGIEKERLEKQALSVPEKTIKNNSKMRVPKVAIRVFVDAYNKTLKASDERRLKAFKLLKAMGSSQQDVEEVESEELIEA